MKKLLIVFSVLSLILSSCAVIPSKNYDTGDTDPIDTPPYEEDPTDEYEEYDPVDDVRYEDIERREALDYKANYYGFQDDGILLNLEHPKEWELKEATVGFDIIREGKVIGYLIGENADDLEDWKVAYRERYSANGINVAMYIEKMISEPSFRYRFAYSYESDGEMRVITLTADYTEVDAQSEEKLCVDAFTIEKEENNIDGALLGCVEEYSPILILGNSFISTSNIGIILKEMLELNAKGCRVKAISRGSAHIGTYIEDKDIIDSIHGGTYSAVFICGLYTMHQITNLEALKKACDQSKTALVIFPAHNEVQQMTSTASWLQNSTLSPSRTTRLYTTTTGKQAATTLFGI